MAGYLADNAILSKLLFVFELIGGTFLEVSQFSSVVRRFVLSGDGNRECVHDCEMGSKSVEDARFVSEGKSLLFLNGSVAKPFKRKFVDFHDYCLDNGMPIASIFMTSRKHCRRCNRLLIVDGKPHVVVVYHSQLGTYLGSRITKKCRNCSLYEHYGYWTEKGERFFDSECLTLEYILSSEETAFEMTLIEQCASLLVVGAVPFSTFAESYNRRFDYRKFEENARVGYKRKKR